MESSQLRKNHVQSFMKLPLNKRLNWAFEQNQFLSRFMDNTAKRINKETRRNGKKYFTDSNLE